MEHLAQLGTELIRIGSILRLHPEDPSIAFENPEVSIPMIEAAIHRTRNPEDSSYYPFTGAIITETEEKILDGFIRLDLTILRVRK